MASYVIIRVDSPDEGLAFARNLVNERLIDYLIQFSVQNAAEAIQRFTADVDAVYMLTSRDADE
jgi:hypothetical protein